MKTTDTKKPIYHDLKVFLISGKVLELKEALSRRVENTMVIMTRTQTVQIMVDRIEYIVSQRST